MTLVTPIPSQLNQIKLSCTGWGWGVNFHYKGIYRRAAGMDIIFTSKIYQCGIFLYPKVYELVKFEKKYMNGFKFCYGKYIHGYVFF